MATLKSQKDINNTSLDTKQAEGVKISNPMNLIKTTLIQDNFKVDAVYKKVNIDRRSRKEPIPQGSASPRRRRVGLTEFGTTSKWRLYKQFGSHDGPGKLIEGNGIAVCPNHDIAVVDSVSKRINVYSKEGQFKMSFKTNQGPNCEAPSYPRQVVVNSKGSYFVTDETRWIKKFTAFGEYQEEHPITLPKVESSSQVNTLSVVGLAMNNNGHLLLGEINRMHICIQQQDGRFINCFKVGIEPVFLAVTSDDLVVISACHMDTGRS